MDTKPTDSLTVHWEVSNDGKIWEHTSHLGSGVEPSKFAYARRVVIAKEIIWTPKEFLPKPDGK